MNLDYRKKHINMRKYNKSRHEKALNKHKTFSYKITFFYNSLYPAAKKQHTSKWKFLFQNYENVVRE